MNGTAGASPSSELWRQVGRAWPVMWRGLDATLRTLVRGESARVLINESVVAEFAAPNAAARWSEVTVDGVSVVLIRRPRRRIEPLVFPEPSSKVKGRTREEWQHRDWHPLDRFEDEFLDDPRVGPPGAVAFFILACFAYWRGSGLSPRSALIGVIAGSAIALWVLFCSQIFLPWLGKKHGVPDAARRLTFAGVFLGLGILGGAAILATFKPYTP